MRDTLFHTHNVQNAPDRTASSAGASNHAPNDFEESARRGNRSGAARKRFPAQCTTPMDGRQASSLAPGSKRGYPARMPDVPAGRFRQSFEPRRMKQDRGQNYHCEPSSGPFAPITITASSCRPGQLGRMGDLQVSVQPVIPLTVYCYRAAPRTRKTSADWNEQQPRLIRTARTSPMHFGTLQYVSLPYFAASVIGRAISLFLDHLTNKLKQGFRRWIIGQAEVFVDLGVICVLGSE